MRLGDLDALAENLTLLAKYEDAFSANVILGVVSTVRNTKTIDAVPVVRCKDCIHYEMGVCLKIYSDGAVSKYAWQERKPDDFCSYGERRGDGR